MIQIIKMWGFLFKKTFLLITLFFCTCYSGAEEILELEKIEVRKQKRDFVYPATFSIEDKQLQTLPLSSFLESLKIGGVDLQSRLINSGIQTDFSIRGSTFQQVLILLGDLRINDPQTAHHNSDLPLTTADISEIQVIAGPGVSLFGPDAIGGAVRFVRKPPRTSGLILEAGSGSHRTKSGLFSITQSQDNFGTRFSLERRESDGFSYDTDFKKFTASNYSEFRLGSSKIFLGLGYEEKEFGAYDFYTPNSNLPSKEWTKTKLLDLSLELEDGLFILKPQFLWRSHEDKFMLDITRPWYYLNHHRTNLYSINIPCRIDLAPIGDVNLGIETGQEGINSTNLGKHTRNHFGICLQDKKDILENLSLDVNGRIDRFNSFGTDFTGSARLAFGLTKGQTIWLGIGNSIRVPSFTELYYNDPTTVGDADLSSESAMSYQAGFDCRPNRRLLYKTNVFFRDENDLIRWAKETPSQAKWQVKNISTASVFGIEQSYEYKITDSLNMQFNYNYLNRRSNDSGILYKYGLNYIKHLLNTILDFDLPFGKAALVLTYKKKPARGGWFLVDTRFSYKVRPDIELYLETTNLFDKEYQEIVGIPQPGRWIGAGMRMEW